MTLVWTEANKQAANVEGWAFTSSPTQPRLNYKASKFYDYTDLHKHIVAKAGERSPLHMKLLALLYGSNRNSLSRLYPKLPDDIVNAIAVMARVAGHKLNQGEVQ